MHKFDNHWIKMKIFILYVTNLQINPRKVRNYSWKLC